MRSQTFPSSVRTYPRDAHSRETGGPACTDVLTRLSVDDASKPRTRYSVGCELVANNSWVEAPRNIPIIGLKELPESADPLPHTHVQFAHCYKQQAGWSSILARFHRGGGTLYDLEFLNDVDGRRVAAFGFHAGFAGAAAGALALAAQRNVKELGPLTPFDTETAMVGSVKQALGGSGKGVRALVIGALGRCGRGAVDLLRKIGLDE